MNVTPALAGLLGLLLTGGMAFSQVPHPSTQSGQPPQRTIVAHPAANEAKNGVDKPDEDFMKHAAQGGLAEIQLAQLAESKASSAAVKSFAARMIKDHSANADLLTSLASSQHVNLPTSVDQQQAQEKAKLSSLSGKQFDQAYMDFMVQSHTKTVNQFRNEAATAQDPTVKQYAAGSLPVLESHLNEAKQIDQQIKGR